MKRQRAAAPAASVGDVRLLKCHVSPRLILGRGSDAGEVVEVLDVDGCGHVEDLLQPRCERALVEGIGVDQERGFEEGAL